MTDFWVEGPDGSFQQVNASDINALAQKLRGPTFAEGAKDFAQSVPTGLAKGVAAIPGVVGDVAAGADYLSGGEQARNQLNKNLANPTAPTRIPTTTDYVKQIEKWTGPLHEPTTPWGHYGEGIGSFAPGALGPGGVTRRAVGGVLVPALLSETAGMATKGTPMESAARFVGGLGGGLLGTRQLPAIGGKAGAERIVSEMFDKSDLSRSRELGPKSFMFEANPSLERVMSGVLQRPGDASTRAAEAIMKRNESAPERLTKEYTAAAGAPVVPSSFKDALGVQKKMLGPSYEQAVQGAPPVNVAPIVNYATSMLPKLSGKPQSAVREAAEMIYDSTGANPRVRNGADEILYARQAMDDQIKRLQGQGQDNAARHVVQMRQLLDDALTRAVPGIKSIDRMYAHISAQESDFDYGARLLRTGGDPVHPADFKRYIAQIRLDTVNDAAMMLPKATSQQVTAMSDQLYANRLESIRSGVRSDLDRIAGTSIYDVTALKRAVQTEGDWNYQKLEEALGGTAANRIFRATNREAEFQRVYNDMLRNSKTAQRMVAERLTNIMDEGGKGPGAGISTGILVGAMTGEPISAVAAGAMSAGLRQKAREFTQALTAGGQRKLDDALVDILMTQSPGGRGKVATDLIGSLMNAKKSGSSWLRTISGTGFGAEGGSIALRPGDQP